MRSQRVLFALIYLSALIAALETLAHATGAVPAAQNQTSGEAPAGDTAEERNWELGLNTNYAVGWYRSDWYKNGRPGAGLSVGYVLSPRWTALAQLDLFRSRYETGWAQWNDSTWLASLGARYWLTDERDWRPYVEASAGYSKYSYSMRWRRDDGSWAESRSSLMGGDFFYSLGAGYRYALGKGWGLDLGANLRSSEAPWKAHGAQIAGKAGVSYRF